MNLQPSSLVTSIVEQPEALMPLVGRIQLLLVRLNEPEGQLAHWLRETTKRDRLTGGREETGSVTRFREPPPSSRALKLSRKARSFSASSLRERLTEYPHFALILIKHDLLSATPSFKIGRSKSRDVVLYDASVSSLHALLDCDEDGVYFVSDKGSTNGTQLNAKPLPKETATDVYPGDIIKFGNIETTLCSVALLRSALTL